LMIEKIQVPVLLSSFKAHSSVKNDILKCIDNDNVNSIIEGDDYISKTDWNVPLENNRTYFQYLTTPLVEHLKEAYGTVGVTGFKIHNIWYQQYNENSMHDWHNHAECQYTNVYFLELNDSSLSTEIKDPFDFNKTIQYNVQEGDILSFPSFLLHKSPKNVSNTRKTVIAFNTSFLTYKI
jgi:hypothetical protein